MSLFQNTNIQHTHSATNHKDICTNLTERIVTTADSIKSERKLIRYNEYKEKSMMQYLDLNLQTFADSKCSSNDAIEHAEDFLKDLIELQKLRKEHNNCSLQSINCYISDKETLQIVN